jgi:tripartite-type tricarboxylate transporter receptor subunit TctC
MFYKILAMFAVSFFAATAYADTRCGVVIDFPPGGTSDKYARLLQKYNKDYRLEYKIGGMSVPAVQFIGDNPEFIYLGSPVLFGDKSPMKNPPIELYKILIGAPILAVTTKPIDWNRLLTDKMNIGVPGLGTSHHLIAAQLKEHNPKIEIIPTKGDNAALPMIMSGDLDMYLISATSGLIWLENYKQITNLFTVEFNKPFIKDNVKLLSVGFNGAFIHKNATPAQRQKAIDCLDNVTKQEGWTDELKKMGAGPVQIVGKEKDAALKLYVDTLLKYSQ